LLRPPSAFPNGAPRRRTFGCSVTSWGQRLRRRVQRRSGGSRSLARSSASGTNLGAGPPRLRVGLRPLGAGALAADLAVAVGSAQSVQAAASEQRARAEGMSWLFRDFDSASFFNLRLKTSALAVCRARVCPQRIRQGTYPGGRAEGGRPCGHVRGYLGLLPDLWS
jgi:hypothetical protein